MKRTKIVATIGPASESLPVLKEMIGYGMNVCRLNFSHGDYDWHKKAIAKIRKAASQKKANVGIMADIQGPRIRVATNKKIEIEEGDKVFLTDEKSTKKSKYKKEIILDWDNFYAFVHQGDRIYIEDGLMDLMVVKKGDGGCVAEVVTGGEVRPRKGVNIPSISTHLGFLTAKDLKDLEFIMSQGVDFVAASFVSSKEDLKNLRNVMAKLSGQNFNLQRKISRKPKKLPWIVSKIENREAIENIDEIIKETDVVMVARGDLAIELPQEKVGVFQKKIIKKCLKYKKPAIVATQMMASMIENSRPTRAEISDVTNAVVDQADAVMLSNETAAGKYPGKVIAMMSKIVKAAEDSPYNDIDLKKTNRFARMLAKARRKKGIRKIIEVKDLQEATSFSVLRQEDIRIRLASRKKDEKRKASVIWGVD